MVIHCAYYQKLTGAIIAAIAATAWILQRLTGKSNAITNTVEWLAPQAKWLLLIIALLAMIVAVLPKRKKETVRQPLRKV